MKGVVWSVKTVKCEMRSGASNMIWKIKYQFRVKVRTHGLGRRAAHASSLVVVLGSDS